MHEKMCFQHQGFREKRLCQQQQQQQASETNKIGPVGPILIRSSICIFYAHKMGGCKMLSENDPLLIK